MGYRRAHKHEDRPGEGLTCERIEQAVIEALCEVLVFGDDYE